MRHLAVLTALLVVLAGCSGAPGGDAVNTESTTADATTVTDAPTTTASTTAETTTGEPADGTEADSGGEKLSPGLSESGVTDAAALTEAHASALRNTSYTVTATLTARDGDTVLARQNSTTRVVHGPARSFQRVETGGKDPAALALSPADVEVWSGANGSWWAADDGNGTTYRRLADDLESAVGDRTGRDRLYVLLGRTDTALAGTTTENGTTLYRVTATDGGDDLLAQTLDADSVANLSASILVGEDDVVRRYHVTYEATVGNVTARVNRTVRFTALGETTVERPGWYDEAVNATAEG